MASGVANMLGELVWLESDGRTRERWESVALIFDLGEIQWPHFPYLVGSPI